MFFTIWLGFSSQSVCDMSFQLACTFLYKSTGRAIAVTAALVSALLKILKFSFKVFEKPISPEPLDGSSWYFA